MPLENKRPHHFRLQVRYCLNKDFSPLPPCLFVDDTSQPQPTQAPSSLQLHLFQSPQQDRPSKNIGPTINGEGAPPLALFYGSSLSRMITHTVVVAANCECTHPSPCKYAIECSVLTPNYFFCSQKSESFRSCLHVRLHCLYHDGQTFTCENDHADSL